MMAAMWTMVARAAALAVALVLGVGCGDDESDAGDATTEETDVTQASSGGTFCEDFAAVGDSMSPDMSGGITPEQAFETAFTGARDAARRMRASAPAEIADAVETLVSELEAAVTVVERYGWDPTLASVEGTPEEQAALRALDGDSEAQRAVLAYVEANC